MAIETQLVTKRDARQGEVISPRPTPEEMRRWGELRNKRNRNKKFTMDEVEEYRRIVRKDAFHRYDTGDLDATTLLLRLHYINMVIDPAKLTHPEVIELEKKERKWQ